jgi:alpha-amylase
MRRKFFTRRVAGLLLAAGLLYCSSVFAQESGVASGIPEPEHRNVIVQLFNWRFEDIRQAIPTLRRLGYSHVHVSPPEMSNEQVWQWWGRYQPVDFSKIDGPLGGEADFQAMTATAQANGIQIIVDVVLNHTVDLTEAPSGLVQVIGNQVVADKFPQFTPEDFHARCNVVDDATAERCWLSNNLLDLKTESPHVRQVAKDYLTKLARLGAAGYRFDAAKHIEPEFFPDVLSAVPGKYAFGELIAARSDGFGTHLSVPDMDYYDFPLVATMREAFRFGGDLRILESPADRGRALPGPKAVTFVRNHDIDRGQANDHGIDDLGGRDTFGVGWDEGQHRLDRTDVDLAYAYVLGREDGLPYVFTDMNTLPPDQQDDRFDDPLIVAGVRFHDLCLADTAGVARRPDLWRIEMPTAIGWQRGSDRFIVINKAADPFEVTNLPTSLQAGQYKEIRTGWPMQVESDGRIQHWAVPPRSAMMFVKIGS